MITINLKEEELYDSSKQEFFTVKAKTIQLEHSLVSIQKWEQKWHVPFLLDRKKTTEQELDYFRCMSINGPISDTDLMRLTADDVNRLNDYINDPMTATKFVENPKGRGQKILTAEMLYSRMISYGIPFECRKWHLNSLMTLIRVCYEDNRPKKKMSKRDTYNRYNQIEAANRRKYGLHG